MTPHGTLTLWLDPGSGNVPLRLRLGEEGNDLMEKTPMRLMKAKNRRWERPNLPERQYELLVDFRPTSTGDRASVEGYVRKEGFVYEGGQEFETRYEFTLGPRPIRPKARGLGADPTHTR